MNTSTKPGRVRGGLLVPSVTICHSNGSVNTVATIDHMVRLASNGAEGAVILGKTGLGDVLPHPEKVALITAVGEARRSGTLPPDFQLLTGTGTSNQDEATNLIWTAQDQEFDGILALPPVSGDQLAFFKHLAITCDIGTSDPLRGKPGHKLDLFLYHYPGTPLNRAVERRTVMLLMGFPCMMGLKDSSGKTASLNLWESIELEDRLLPKVFMGSDFLVLDGLLRGAFGAIAGSGNTAEGLPLLVELFASWRRNDGRNAQRCQDELSRHVSQLLKVKCFLDNVMDNLLQ